jgi:hypothetical protein
MRMVICFHIHKAGSDEIPAELIKTGGEILHSKFHELINSIWNKKELPDHWKESIIAQVHKKDDRNSVAIIVGYHCYQLHTKFYLIFLSQGNVHIYI